VEAKAGKPKDDEPLDTVQEMGQCCRTFAEAATCIRRAPRDSDCVAAQYDSQVHCAGAHRCRRGSLPIMSHE
jgi:hypothetical protein